MFYSGVIDVVINACSFVMFAAVMNVRSVALCLGMQHGSLVERVTEAGTGQRPARTVRSAADGGMCSRFTSNHTLFLGAGTDRAHRELCGVSVTKS